MRIHVLTLGLALAALSGCLNVPAVENAGPAGPPALRAWIGFPVGSSRIFPMFVNRDAHVALFEIVPGRGVTMVYPTSGADVSASDAHYANLTVQHARMFYDVDPFGHSAYQPRYYYLVASVAPLNLTRLRASFGATRKVLGPMYASYRPYDVIDRLTELVVPMQSDEDWTTDLFVHWPSAPPPPVFASTRFITCANGRVFVVPRNYPYFGCPGDPEAQLQGQSHTSRPTDAAGRDSLRLRPPEARPTRPLPEVSRTRDVAERRRAVAGARPPGERARAVTPTRTRANDRYDANDRRGARDRSSPAPASAPVSRPTSTTREAPSRGTESSTPRAEPRAPSSGSEGTRKNP